MSQSIAEDLFHIVDTLDGYCSEIADMHVNLDIDYHTEGISPYEASLKDAIVHNGRASFLVGEARKSITDATALIKQARASYQEKMDVIIDTYRVKYSSSSWEDQKASYNRRFDEAYGYEPTIELSEAEHLYDRANATLSAMLEMCNNYVYKARIDIQAILAIISPGIRGEY